MIAVDYVLLSIFGVSAIIGVFRGFVKEAISLIGWIAAIWGAWQYGANVSAWLPDFVDDATVKIWAARLLVLIGVLIMSGLISRLVSFLIDKTGLSGTDRMVGMVFGLARGMVLAGLAVNLLEVAGFDEAPWWPESKLIPYAAPVAQRLSDIATEGLDMLDKPLDQIESPIALP
jgi:membrane protein required for colicin V production